MEFSAMTLAATTDDSRGGVAPWPFQQRIADEGLPEVLDVPTGCGKTLAAALPWLYRRRHHNDLAVRDATPRRLVLVLPLRTLVDQTVASVTRWRDNLGVSDEALPVVTLMGGDSEYDGRWRLHPERDAILVGTLDMVLSRALLRGYATSRFSWAIDAGLLNNDCSFVFDEVQLFGPALPTSRQLDGLRRSLGTARSCTSTWMSATVDDAAMITIDNPTIGSRIGLGDADRVALAQRLDSTRRVGEVSLPDAKRYVSDLAAHVAQRHRPGTRSLVVLNTVARAQQVFGALRGTTGAELVLLHSRYRPGDRRLQAQRALADVAAHSAGLIVVSTQVLEAGVDISSAVLTTEAAPWASVVQRAGRCNRDGLEVGAELWWCEPPAPAPYDAEDVSLAVQALRDLAGTRVTSTDLRGRVTPRPVHHPILRRRDVLGLFDTTPDVGGNDLDIGPYLRDANDTDVQVLWREFGGTPDSDQPAPKGNELCAVPLWDLAKLLTGDQRGWTWDHLDSSWRAVHANQLRPGQVVLVSSGVGGYADDVGWDRTARGAVTLVNTDEQPDEQVAVTETVAAEAGSLRTGRWVPLIEHLMLAELTVRDILAAIDAPGLTRAHVEAAAIAARLHDVGKAHETFQEMLLGTAAEDQRDRLRGGTPWAKSGGHGRSRYPLNRQYFRHELATALALLDAGEPLLAAVQERDLTVYLAAAHHGRVRLGARSLDGETDTVLGIREGDSLPVVGVPAGELPAANLSLSWLRLGDCAGRPSYTARALALRDRDDLGPFRLAFLEAVVRMADWRSSKAAEEEPG